MKSFSQDSANTDVQENPSELLRIAVTFKGRSTQGVTKFPARLSAASIAHFDPQPGEMERAIEYFKKLGFVLSGKGNASISIRGTRELFEKTFGTELAVHHVNSKNQEKRTSFYYPPDGAKWNPDPELSELIDDAYIQWPHIYMSSPISSTPPSVPAYHLNVLSDVPRLLNVTRIHQSGHFGEGIRIAMIDTGFDHSHPFFVSNGFTSSVTLAPGATNRATDPESHGTGESANIFAIAPKATFIGIKLEDDQHPGGGASIMEGFHEALKHDPHIITISMGYDLRAADGVSELPNLPNTYKGLETEILNAIARNIVVVFSAGNGHYAFPGSMPEVISAGGVYIDQAGKMRASNYASAFPSKIYSGRNVPDFCGLVGLLPHAAYIMLPVPEGNEIDEANAAHDGTRPNDGWALFSGTSAAAPQLAAICALIKEKNPNLTPSQIKALLSRTARDVKVGSASPFSDPKRKGVKAGSGADGATGAGLVDAYSAWLQA